MQQASTSEQERRNDIDVILLEQIAQDRNSQAMQTLFNSYRARLVPFLRRMTRDETIIEETYNDVMLTLWNKADQFKGNAKVSSWIFSIAYRMCLKLIKRQQLRDKLLDSFSFFKLVEDQEEPEMNDSPEADLLNTAIAKLPAKQRLVVELSYFQGCSIQEISDIAQCPLNTVKTRLHHARLKLREYMDEAKLGGDYYEV